MIQQHPTFSDHTYPLHISRPHCDINWDHFASCGGYKDNTCIPLGTTWRSRRPLLSAHHRPDIHYWVNSQCIGQGGQSGADLKFSWPHCNRAGPSQPLIPQCIFFHRMHLHSDQLYWIFLWFRSWSKHFGMAFMFPIDSEVEDHSLCLYTTATSWAVPVFCHICRCHICISSNFILRSK